MYFLSKILFPSFWREWIKWEWRNAVCCNRNMNCLLLKGKWYLSELWINVKHQHFKLSMDDYTILAGKAPVLCSSWLVGLRTWQCDVRCADLQTQTSQFAGRAQTVNSTNVFLFQSLIWNNQEFRAVLSWACLCQTIVELAPFLQHTFK